MKTIETVTYNGTTYMLVSNEGLLELHVAGEDGFFCGYVSSEEYMQDAIDAHEEEMGILFEDAKIEFGL
jgi:hypothetical protein